MRLPYNGYFPITQLFGVNPANYAAFGLKGHNGIDFAIPTGTDILAPFSGTIKEAYFDATGYGNYIKIEDAVQGSVLGHLQSFLVKIGQVVSEGDRIGISDNTGNSTGPHLHWGYYKFPRNRSNGYDGFIDQYELIKPFLSPDELITIGKKVYADLTAKLDAQTQQISKLTNDYNSIVALKDSECQSKINAKVADIKTKIIALINNF